MNAIGDAAARAARAFDTIIVAITRDVAKVRA